MGSLTSRRLLQCLAVPLIVAQVGCAARGGQIPAASSLPSIAEEDRKRCADFAKRAAKGVSTRSVAEASAEGFAYGLLGGIFMLFGAGIILAPAAGVIEGIDQAVKNSSVRKAAYVSAEGICLEPVALAATLGPRHPHLAVALRQLADVYAEQKDYVAAESLYQRALEIQQQFLGPEIADEATTLDAYARLLRATNRDEQATGVTARADAIRARFKPHAATDITAANDGTLETDQPGPASASTPPAANERE